MMNYHELVEINHDQNWLYISDHPYRILTIVVSVSGQTNVLLNEMKYWRLDFNKVYLHIQDQFKIITY